MVEDAGSEHDFAGNRVVGSNHCTSYLPSDDEDAHEDDEPDHEHGGGRVVGGHFVAGGACRLRGGVGFESQSVHDEAVLNPV